LIKKYESLRVRRMRECNIVFQDKQCWWIERACGLECCRLVTDQGGHMKDNVKEVSMW